MKKFLIALLFVPFIFSFASCDDVIFDTIRDEVKLSSAKVTGDIKRVVRYKNNIFVCNGNIYYKPKDSKSSIWIKHTRPESSLYDICADENYLYAVSLTFIKDEDGYNVASKRNLWCYSEENGWKQVSLPDSTIGVYSPYFSFTLMCTNSPQESHRFAYMRYGSTVYKLNGTSTTTVNSADVKLTPGSQQKLSNVHSCVYSEVNDTVVMTDFYTMTSNELETGSNPTPCIYTGSTSSLFYSTDGGDNWSTVLLSSGHLVTALACTSDYMLIGTNKGIEHVAMEGVVPTNVSLDFITNAASALSSYYQINSLLTIDSSLSELTSTIYATMDFESNSSGSTTSMDSVGLWAYYPTTMEWNRE